VTSLAVAVACVTFSASVLGGFSKEMERLAFGDYGRALVVRANPFAPSRHGPPTLNDRTVLLETLEGVQSSAAWVEGVASIRFARETRIVPVYGVLGDYRKEIDAPLAGGRWFTDQELLGLPRVCLVGPTLAAELARGDETLDSRLTVGGVQCRIVGVLGEGRSRPAARFADAVIAPFATARRYLADSPSETPPALRDADWLTFFMEPDVHMEDARYEADRIMRQLAGVPLSREAPFLFDDPAALVREQDVQRRLLTRLLVTITSAALIACVVGYAGVTFSTTLARRREIALRLAVGGVRRDIWKQFLVEQILLGTTASVIGLCAGLAGAVVVGAVWHWPIFLSWTGAALSIGVGLLVGVLAGMGAADMAAKTSPALAARG